MVNKNITRYAVLLQLAQTKYTQTIGNIKENKADLSEQRSLFIHRPQTLPLPFWQQTRSEEPE